MRDIKRLPGVIAAAIIIAMGLSAVVVSLSHDAKAATTGPEVGVVGDLTWGISSADVDRTVASMANAGIRWVRANVNWAAGEPNGKGSIDESWLSQTDYVVNKARAAGLNVLMPISDGVPYWASADPAKYTDESGGHWNKTWRPASFTDYADFVRYVVGRYKNSGVHTFELWNEPNLARFWPSGPNAAEFKSLLAAAYPVVKQTDPSATVLLGGLSKNDYKYLQELYTAGGGAYFDAVAVHPYTGSADPTWCWNEAGTTQLAVDAFCGIEQVRATMVANGDSAKSMWLTEFGWSTTTSGYGVSEATQATFLTAAFTKLQGYPYVKAAFWYSFRDTGTDATDYEANLGLVRNSYTTKPAYDAMRTYTGGATPPPAPVADTTAPVLSAIAVRSITRSAATISWTTNEPSSSRVEYWVGTKSAKAVTNASMVTAHALKLSPLSRSTKYSYRVRSTDAAGNTAVSGTYYFTTPR